MNSPQPTGTLTALRDDLIMRSMLARVGDVPEAVLLPVLRVVADDRAAVDAGWAAVTAKRTGNRFLEGPRWSWKRRYGQFVTELEWASTELTKVMPVEDVTDLVATAVSIRLRRWLRYLLPAFASVRFIPKGMYPSVMDAGVGFATFLVGPIHRTAVEADGTLVYEIGECAMHASVSAPAAQTNSCLMGCKAACERVFDPTSAMPLEFEPHLPELSCTLRVRPALS
ncbi:hypothetical protein IU501_21810 [Nocardia otitidiscaviarum]|uniref:hypothetical protein n=1 Tax=Nocardia otitidiscaviarum TaxID=1823 RepID=UPI0004A785DB|nr:hypothetical protein [Nocardia otitidiscaviarum]MBF6135628.1 hypothetical protein [Nocardia otitidiscaviarum]MBF6487446.1 hypothetical protein [Nocardia otitidiscaviarum]